MTRFHGTAFLPRTCSRLACAAQSHSMSSMNLVNPQSRCHARTLAVVALAALAAGCRAGDTRAPLSVQHEAWSYRSIPGTILTTPHYRIHTTCNDAGLL